MADLRGQIESLNFSFDGSQLLTVRLTEDARAIYDKLKDCECDFSVKKHREKRSKDANSYMWVLCDKIAEVINSTKEEVYKTAVHDVGVFKDFCNMSQKDADTLRHAWELLGTGWVTEQVDYSHNGENVTVRCYYGSSQYNTKQMSRLVDYIVNECKCLDIETKTPDELAILKASWGNE